MFAAVSRTLPSYTPSPYRRNDPAAAGSDSPDAEQRTRAPASSSSASSSTQQLDEDQIRQLTQLQARDRSVRNHEAAHQAAAGGLATSGASFSYQRGPDGQLYAIGGEVHIDVSPVSGNPSATAAKAETIMRAALAPADPSGQDRQVATQAAQMAAKARAELSAQSHAPHGHGSAKSSDPTEAYKTTEAADQSATAANLDTYA